MNEAETRAELIDPALKAAGWGVVEGSFVKREYQITQGRLQGAGQKTKPEIADYVLVYQNRKLAVIEAKRAALHYTEGLAQAKAYATKLETRFAYATNGKQIYAVDMQTGHEQDVLHFPSPDELWQQTFAEANQWRDKFNSVPFEDVGGTKGARYYQENAINHVLEALAGGQERILLTLATGTGKTFIAFQIAWKLFQSRWNLSREPSRRPRVLFLADRNILANQAYNAFSAFAEDALVRIKPDEISKKGRVPKNGSIFFTIFQTFMSGKDAQGQPAPNFGEYPPDFFDLIIIDECHRGGANDESNWRGILEYFAPAVQLGLTATPKRRDNADTYAYFGEPVYSYSLKEGINDGFLTPFKVKQIATTLDEYVYTADDYLVEGDIEEGKRYLEADFNRIIEIKQREEYRVKLMMQQIDQREKTLVFCATQDHALAVRDLISQLKTNKDPNYCVRVTAADGERGEQFLRDFQDNEKSIPTILTTSQKLSTGVDARNVRNIVLMRPVNSMIEFKQIIGRGTRLYDGKDYFTIYDFVKAHHHFSDPEWDGEPIELVENLASGDAKRTPHEPREMKQPEAEYEARKKIKVKLRDGKERTIQHMMATTFWSADGRPMSSAQFMAALFGVVPEFFKNEDELREIWSNPETRKKLLEGLADKGFGKSQLAEMQKMIDAENSDIYDVLANVAYCLTPLTRTERASAAQLKIHQSFEDKEEGFLAFVLGQYIKQGVDELSQEKLKGLLELKYQSVHDATKVLGNPQAIRKMFVDFQQHLYSN
jgi:type I restriction enzyme, R subunit